MQAIRMLVRQVNEGRAVENEFTRAVTAEGNLKAQAPDGRGSLPCVTASSGGARCCPVQPCVLPMSAEFDAERRFWLDYTPQPDHKACECAAVLRGVAAAWECSLFGRVCTRRHRWRLHGVVEGPVQRITPKWAHP